MNRKNIKKSSKTNNKDKKPNTILWIGLVVILVPCLILLYILLGRRKPDSQLSAIDLKESLIPGLPMSS